MPVVHEAMDCAKIIVCKRGGVSRPCSDSLLQKSRQLCRSANDKDDNEVKSGAVHRSPGINLTAEVILS